MTSSSSFPYLFWGILFSCWLRFELNQPPSKTHYLWQNCGRMWLSMFSPFWNHQKNQAMNRSPANSPEKRSSCGCHGWLFGCFFVEKEIFAWQVPLETSCHDFLRVETRWKDIFVSIDHTLAGSLTVSVETAGLEDLLGQWEWSETKL